MPFSRGEGIQDDASFPLGALRATWELDAWWVRVDRTDLVRTWEGNDVVLSTAGSSREWRAGAGVRLSLAYSFGDDP